MDHFTVASCVTTGLIIFAIIGIILRLGRRRDFYRHASKFPGPPTLPIIGNAHLFAGSTQAIMDKLIDLSKLYPAPYRVWIGNCLLIFVSTSDQLKVVLNSPKTIERGDLFNLVQPWLGTGILTASRNGGEYWCIVTVANMEMHNQTSISQYNYFHAKWRVHRKLLQPTFGITILQSFVKVFSARSTMIAKEMKRNLDGPEFEISNYTSQYALHTICETTMGVNLEAHENGTDCYAEASKKVIASTCRRLLSPWLHPDFIFYRTPLGKDQQKRIKFLHTFTDNVIRRKKKELLEQANRSGSGSADDEDDDDNKIPRRKAFLDHLIEVSREGNKLSDEALRDEVSTIMVTGYDTTAVTSSYVMLMLASHPEVQEKVYRELCEIYGDNDSEEVLITPEDLTRMTYLERVIKETLRLFPNVPFIIRSVTEDLDAGEHTFPAGSEIILSILGLHRNGDVWPDPLKFDPDRFLPEEVQKRDPYAYLPFGGGPKICIGSKYGMMSIKTFLATILQRYVLKKDNITPMKDLRFRWEFVMRPVDPITLRIEKRSI